MLVLLAATGQACLRDVYVSLKINCSGRFQIRLLYQNKTLMLLQNLAQNSQLGEDVPLLGVKKLWATQDVWIEVVNCNHLWYLHCYHSSCLTV